MYVIVYLQNEEFNLIVYLQDEELDVCYCIFVR